MEFRRLDDLLCGRKLVDPHDPNFIEKLKELKDQISEELDTCSQLSDLNSGVLLGALNFILGMLEHGKVEKSPQVMRLS
jgi:hypothetical protein